MTVERPRPARRGRSHRVAESRWSALLGGIDPFYIAIAVMVFVVAGVSWWAVGRKDAAVAASTPDQAAEVTSAASGTSGAAPNPGTEAQPEGSAEGLELRNPEAGSCAPVSRPSTWRECPWCFLKDSAPAWKMAWSPLPVKTPTCASS